MRLKKSCIYFYFAIAKQRIDIIKTSGCTHSAFTQTNETAIPDFVGNPDCASNYLHFHAAVPIHLFSCEMWKTLYTIARSYTHVLRTLSVHKPYRSNRTHRKPLNTNNSSPFIHDFGLIYQTSCLPIAPIKVKRAPQVLQVTGQIERWFNI